MLKAIPGFESEFESLTNKKKTLGARRELEIQKAVEEVMAKYKDQWDRIDKMLAMVSEDLPEEEDLHIKDLNQLGDNLRAKYHEAHDYPHDHQEPLHPSHPGFEGCPVPKPEESSKPQEEEEEEVEPEQPQVEIDPDYFPDIRVEDQVEEEETPPQVGGFDTGKRVLF